jgi:hypothetical protein
MGDGVRIIGSTTFARQLEVPGVAGGWRESRVTDESVQSFARTTGLLPPPSR